MRGATGHRGTQSCGRSSRRRCRGDGRVGRSRAAGPTRSSGLIEQIDSAVLWFRLARSRALPRRVCHGAGAGGAASPGAQRWSREVAPTATQRRSPATGLSPPPRRSTMNSGSCSRTRRRGRGGDALCRVRPVRGNSSRRAARSSRPRAESGLERKMERLRDAGTRPNDLDPEDQVGWLACLQAFRSRRTCTRTFSTAIPGSYVGARQYCLDTLSRIAENAESF